MNRPFHAHLPFVVVEWHDVWKSAVDDVTVDNAHEGHKHIVCYTAGWLLLDNEKGVQIANEYSPDGTHRGTTFVLRALVVSVTPVTLVKPRVKKVKEAHGTESV